MSKLSDRFLKKQKIEEPKVDSSIKESFFEKIDTVPVWSEFEPEKQKEMIKTFLTGKVEDKSEIDELADELYTCSSGFGPIQNLVDNEKVTTVFLNGQKDIYIEIDGKVLNTEIKLSEKEFSYIKKFAGSDIGIFRKDNFLIRVLSEEIIIIKKIQPCDETLLNDTIINALAERKNIVISGAVNSGKTAFLNALINSCQKRSVLLQEVDEIDCDNDGLMKFKADKNSDLDYVIKLMPEIIFADLNIPLAQITDYNGIVITLRAPSIEAAMKKLVASHIAYENLPEKFARTKVLTHIDYLVHISNGSVSVIELTPAKTAAASMKVIR